MDIETLVRGHVGRIVKPASLQPQDVSLDASLARDYAVSSMRMVLLMTALCEEAGIALSNFTDDDLGAIKTPGDLVSVLSKHSLGVAE